MLYCSDWVFSFLFLVIEWHSDCKWDRPDMEHDKAPWLWEAYLLSVHCFSSRDRLSHQNGLSSPWSPQAWVAPVLPHPADLLSSSCPLCVVVALSCPTLCDPTGCSLSGLSFHGILQARILEWVAMPSSRGSSWLRDGTLVCLQADSLPPEPTGKPFCLWVTFFQILKCSTYLQMNITWPYTETVGTKPLFFSPIFLSLVS